MVILTDRSGREASASLSVSRTPSSKVISKDRSTQGTDRISESIKAVRSHGHERSASESSVAEELSIPTRDRSQDQSERSRDSSIPEVDMKTRSQGSSIPEEIPEEYVNDTFESLDSSATPAHSTPVRSDLTLKRDTSPALSRRSSTGEGSKSEEDTSMTGELYSMVSSRGKLQRKLGFPLVILTSGWLAYCCFDHCCRITIKIVFTAHSRM